MAMHSSCQLSQISAAGYYHYYYYPWGKSLISYIYYKPANAGLLHITRQNVEAISVCAAQSAAIQALNGRRNQQQPLLPLFKAWNVYSAQFVRSNDGANTLNPSSRVFFRFHNRQTTVKDTFEWKDLKDSWKNLCIVNRAVTPLQMGGGRHLVIVV